MAKNIIPTNGQRDNEVLGLINWSLPFIKGVIALTLIVGCSLLMSVIRGLNGGDYSSSNTWVVAQSVAFFLIALHTFQIFRFGNQYVQSESDASLARALVFLSLYWVVYGFLTAAFLLPVIEEVGIQFWGMTLSSYFVPVKIFVFPLCIVGFYGLLLKDRLNTAVINHSFIKEIPKFAKGSFWKASVSSFFSISVGVVLIVIYMFDLFPQMSGSATAKLFFGLSFIVIGSTGVFYWRGVREILRNPSLIYFERTLERLNLFWFAACIGFSAQMIARLFE